MRNYSRYWLAFCTSVRNCVLAWLLVLETKVDLQTQRMTTAVQLIAALGGGWDVSDLPR